MTFAAFSGRGIDSRRPEGMKMFAQTSRIPQEAWRGDRGAPPDSWRDDRRSGISWFELLSLAAVAAVVVGGIALAPDVARYIRIRNM
jgi:hypothetical protein